MCERISSSRWDVSSWPVLLGRREAASSGRFRLRRAVEPDDAMHPDVGHGLLCVVLLVRQYLADDLKVGAIGQTSCDSAARTAGPVIPVEVHSRLRPWRTQHIN